MSDHRRQINFRDSETGETHKAIEEVRRLLTPIPTASEVMRDAVREYRDRIVRKVEREKALTTATH